MRTSRYSVLGVILMYVKDAVVARFEEIMKERKLCVNALAGSAGVTPSTVYSMMDSRRRELSISTIKKLCDGLEISRADFFSAPVFDELEQEIR